MKLGLVSNLSRPGGNLTGLSQLNNALASKRLELPTVTAIAFLANPNNPNTLANTTNLKAAARLLDTQLHVLNASSEDDFEMAFATAGAVRLRGLTAARRVPSCNFARLQEHRTGYRLQCLGGRLGIEHIGGEKEAPNQT